MEPQAKHITKSHAGVLSLCPAEAEEGHEWQMKCSFAFVPERAGSLWVEVTARAEPARGCAALGCYLTLTSGMENRAHSQLIISLS